MSSPAQFGDEVTANESSGPGDENEIACIHVVCSTPSFGSDADRLTANAALT